MTESQNIEFKETWRDEYLKWICGFANAQGGKLYIGVNDKGEAIGAEKPDRLLEDLPSKVKNAMNIIVDVNLIEKDGKRIIEVVVPAYPVAVACKGVYYYRSGSTLQTMTGTELENFLSHKRGTTWDNMPLPSFTADDLDDKLIEKFKKMAVKKGRLGEEVLAESKEDLMNHLQLTNAGSYTNAAMLLFSKNPDRWQLGAYTKLGFFETDADLIYQDEIHGSIIEQVDQIIDTLHLKYMKAKITYEGMYRVERYFVPEAALREAVLNALCHKDYSSGIPIQISVYEDRLYVGNVGQFPDGLTVENLMKKHTSKPFNPSIAHVLYLAGLIESWGRGIEKICTACKNDGVSLPEYDTKGESVMVKFTAPEDRIVRFSGGVTDKVTEKVTDRVTEKEQEILDLLAQNAAATSSELCTALSISRKTLAARIKSLKEKGKLERIGSDKKGYWKVR